MTRIRAGRLRIARRLLRGWLPLLLAIAVLFGIAACADGSETPVGSESGTPALDSALVEAGRPLYEEYCAACHGISGEGVPNWRTPNEDGSYPPPPQDSSGHTWHHADDLLVDLIANGSDFAQSRMPAFGDRLSEGQIVAILEYIKTWWGPAERQRQWEISQSDS